jgi:glycosyltransferase involved in cell wall biosynthesis
MRILILCSRIPYPLNDGGNLAVNSIMEGLINAGEAVSMLSMNTKKHWVDPNTLPSVFKQLHHFETVDVDTDVKMIPAVISLLRNKSYNITRFISDAFDRALKALLLSHNFDIVLLEGLYVSPYLTTIKKYSQAKICYRQHNVEFQIWERLASEALNPLKKWYLNRLAKALKSYERSHINQYDCIAAIAPTDKYLYQNFGCTLPISVVPFGLKLENEPQVPKSTNEALKCYHIGAMDWQPNVEGVKWLVEEIWPRVITQVPHASLHLAGRNFDPNTQYAFRKNVFIYGAVPDAAAFEADKDILLVPIHAGGGLRIKTLIAMNRGKAVISTSIGLQGIEHARHKEEVLLANAVEEFSASIISLYQNPEQVVKMGAKAMELVQSTYNQEHVIKELLQHLHQILNLPPRALN